jgi:hypothetical protein
LAVGCWLLAVGCWLFHFTRNAPFCQVTFEENDCFSPFGTDYSILIILSSNYFNHFNMNE